jgi:hypothetical protein
LKGESSTPAISTQLIVIHDLRPRKLPTDHAHARTREYQNDHRRRTLSADGSAAPIEKPKAGGRQQGKNKFKGKTTAAQLDRVTPYQPVASAEGRAATG